MKVILLYFLLPILICNGIISIFFKADIMMIFLSYGISSVNLYLLFFAISKKKMHTFQDGWIFYHKSPIKFIATVLLLFAGYILGLLAPWLG